MNASMAAVVGGAALVVLGVVGDLYARRSDSDGLLVDIHTNLSTDDAPVRAEVLGVLLALGLTGRSLCHMLTAVVADLHPRLAGHDASAASPVVAVRDAPLEVDVSARIVTMLAGVAVWALADPLSMQWPGPAWMTVAGQTYLGANIGVLLADPLLFVLDRLRSTDNETTHNHA